MKKNKMKMVYGNEARTPRGFAENIQHMEKKGYSKKRAIGTAYGEADRGNISYDELQKMIKNL